MNVLLVIPFQLSDVGGISTVVTMLAREFSRKQHQVSVLVHGDSNRVRPVNGIKDARAFNVYLRTPYVRKAPVRGLIAFCLFLPFTLYQLHRFLVHHHINIVTIQYPLPWVFYFAILRPLCRWKLVVTYQGNDAHDLPLWSWPERRLIRFLLTTSDCVVAVSNSLLYELGVVFPDLQMKESCIIPNGAPLDLISETNTVKTERPLPQEYLFTAGHLIHRKGIDVLIEALAVARDQGEVMNLVVAGEGPERQKFSNLAREVGLTENIHFVGDQPHETVLDLLKNCLFFVLASRAEGMPLVIAEAMACGKAVVATNVDGIPEIVQEGRTGLLVGPDDARSLAEAIITVYRNPTVRQELGSHGKELVWREYAWEAIATRYLSLFKELSRNSRVGG